VSSSWDISSLVCGALSTLLAEALEDDCKVLVGWAGNKPFGPETSILAIQCETPRIDDHAAEMTSFVAPAEDADPVAPLVLEYGTAVAVATLNLYTVGARAKTRRAEMAKRVADFLNDFKPGYAPGLIVRLDTPELPYCRFTVEGVTHRDEPEGIQREEWRTLIKVRAHLALLTTVQAPFCRTIQLGETAAELIPVDDIAE